MADPEAPDVTSFGDAALPQLVDDDELRRRLKISRTTLWRLITDGKLPYLIVGGRRRYNLAEVNAALVKLRDASAAAK